jgi:hypothetical protein
MPLSAYGRIVVLLPVGTSAHCRAIAVGSRTAPMEIAVPLAVSPVPSQEKELAAKTILYKSF